MLFKINSAMRDFSIINKFLFLISRLELIINKILVLSNRYKIINLKHWNQIIYYQLVKARISHQKVAI